ncbi:MAG: xanthine dehydrogenase family protein subunit M, partial [Thermoleophilaceae bacterium]|nr:xanthine dehydrogenase family protein subunit M [Thermoleophilaceae bacterium]
MIPPEFEYERAGSVDAAIQAIASGGEDAKLLAGGHSLIPLMKLRLAAPTLLVDIGGLEELRGVERSNGGWRIGALTTHATLEDSQELGLLAGAAHEIADQQVRNRGTIGGSLAHGDPASDLPTVVLAMEGEIAARGANGERRIAASELFQDYLTTTLDPGEVLTAIHVPALDDWGWGYRKFTRRAEDWAMVGVCALVKAAGDTCEDVRIGLTNMGSTP